MKKVLITGSEGFLGQCLMQKIDDSEYEIYSLDRVPSLQSRENHFVYTLGGDYLEEIPKIKNLEVVIHLAAQIDVRSSFEMPLEDLKANGLGTLELIDYASRLSVKHFVYIHSGGASYSASSHLPISEDALDNPISPYGLTKLLGESYVRIFCERNGINWSSLALSNVFGDLKLNPKGVIFEFWKSLNAGKQPDIFGAKVTRDFVYVEDVADAILLTMKHPTNCRINISSEVETSLESLFNEVANILGSTIRPNIHGPRAGEILRSALSNKKAKELIGWAPRHTLIEALNSILSKRD
jgi:UDP-glucose 4-epimerase